MPRLFMNGIQLSVPHATVLTFLSESQSCSVRFHIAGVVFETTEDVVTNIPDSFFALFLANPMMNIASSDTPLLKDRVLSGPEFESAELYPLIFDFMCRKLHDPKALLRTELRFVCNNHAIQSSLLFLLTIFLSTGDFAFKIEKRLLPH